MAISVTIGAIVLGGMSVLRFYLGPSWVSTDRQERVFAAFKIAYVALFAGLPVIEYMIAAAIARAIYPELKTATAIGFLGSRGS